MQNRTWKRLGIFLLLFFILLGILAWLAYSNRQKFYPKVEEVTYLRIALESDTAEVHAGIRVQNRAPVPFKVDSVNYLIRNNGNKLGWGGQIVGERLHAFSDEVLDFRLFLDTDSYRNHMAMHKDHDSLDLEIVMHVYIDPPFFGPHTFKVNRTLTTAVPKAPAMKIDSLLVKSFSPDAGYHFQLNLNTGETRLPDMSIEGLKLSVRIGDSMMIESIIDSAFQMDEDSQLMKIPIRLKTAEVIKLLRLKLNGQDKWDYDAKATAILKSAHPLFEEVDLEVTKSGMLDVSKVGDGAAAMPSVKRLESLTLNIQDQNIYLNAGLSIHNPTILPLYIDSARYTVSYQGKIIAQGGGNYEKTLPAKQSQHLKLQLTVDKEKYKELGRLGNGKKEIPLDVELKLIYDFKDSKRQELSVKKQLQAPVPQKAGLKLKDLQIKELDPDKGAHILLVLGIENSQIPELEIANINYNLKLGDINIAGRIPERIKLEKGQTEVEVPLTLTGGNVNELVRQLVEGTETWDYTFNGSAEISTQSSLLQNTEIALQTSGTYDIDSKGSPDYMPEISKIDTLNATIHYDTAWVHMYAAIYNTLPLNIYVTHMKLAVIHENDTIGKSDKELNITLVPDTNSFAWHTFGVDYGSWQKHLAHHQGEDSVQLFIPTNLTFQLSGLDEQIAQIDLHTQIPTPSTPVTLLQNTKLKGLSLRDGLKFDALIIIQNANAVGLEVKNIDYKVKLENGVDFSGKLDTVYQIPVGRSEIIIPINLSIWESLKMMVRTLLGPPEIHYTINATANLKTANLKMQDIYIIFENKNVSNLKEKKTLKDPPQPHQSHSAH